MAPETFPVALTSPPVVKFPPVTFPVEVKLATLLKFLELSITIVDPT